MPALPDRAREVLPSGLAGFAGLVCAACCVVPLLAAGVLSGAGWAAAGAWMPGIAVALAALAGAATGPAAQAEHGVSSALDRDNRRAALARMSATMTVAVTAAHRAVPAAGSGPGSWSRRAVT